MNILSILYEMPGYNKKCELCDKFATYNDLDSNGPKWCLNHRNEHSVNKKVRICLFPGCHVQASYNYEGTNVGIMCLRHKCKDHILVTCKTCEVYGCMKQPSYGLEYGKSLTCIEHKQDNYICVKTRKCLVEDCESAPCYGKPNSKIRLYCESHKDIIPDLEKNAFVCSTEGCSKQSTYCYINARSFTHCSDCKREGMVNGKKRKIDEIKQTELEEKHERYKKAWEFLLREKNVIISE